MTEKIWLKQVSGAFLSKKQEFQGLNCKKPEAKT
jgi:hypothetical protein